MSMILGNMEFDGLTGGSILQEFRDMLDDTQGLSSEEAFLASEIENPLDAGGFSMFTPTDEDDFGMMSPDGDVEPGQTSSDLELEEEALSAEELDEAKNVASLSEAFQAQFSQKRGG